jgi:adenylate cyclase
LAPCDPRRSLRHADRDDREFTDVFAIQDEISRSVADALKVRLVSGSAEGLRARAVVNAEAYRVYLVARSKVRERGLENTQSAVRLYDEAAAIDPRFAGAYAGKALALMLIWFNHAVGDSRTMLADAEHAARRALELDPDSSEAHVALGRVAELAQYVTGENRRDEARQHYQRALSAAAWCAARSATAG